MDDANSVGAFANGQVVYWVEYDGYTNHCGTVQSTSTQAADGSVYSVETSCGDCNFNHGLRLTDDNNETFGY